MHDPFSNESVIHRLKNGDRSVIDIIFARYHKALCLYADNIIADEKEAQDIVTESFLKLWDKHTSFSNIEKVKGFLYKVTHNACVDLLRKRKRETTNRNELSYLHEDHTQQNFEEKEIHALLMGRIYARVAELPEQCRLVFNCVFLEGLSTAATANRLGISQQTVLNQKAIAIKKLRLHFPDKGLLLICLLMASQLLYQAAHALVDIFLPGLF